MNDLANIARPASGRPALYSRKPRDTDLPPREQLLIAYIVFGCDTPARLTRIQRLNEQGDLAPVEPGVPLTLNEAAQLARIRPRHARFILASPAGNRLLTKLTNDLRNGARAHAMNRIVEQLDRPQIKAADAKVVQEAAALVLGDSVGTPPARNGVTVNVQNNVVTPGYVIVRPADRAQPNTIEHTTADTHADVERER